MTEHRNEAARTPTGTTGSSGITAASCFLPASRTCRSTSTSSRARATERTSGSASPHAGDAREGAHRGALGHVYESRRALSDGDGEASRAERLPTGVAPDGAPRSPLLAAAVLAARRSLLPLVRLAGSGGPGASVGDVKPPATPRLQPRGGASGAASTSSSRALRSMTSAGSRPQPRVSRALRKGAPGPRRPRRRPALLNRAIELESRPIRRGELEWALAQAFIFWDEPGLALEFARRRGATATACCRAISNFSRRSGTCRSTPGPRPAKRTRASSPCRAST